METMLQNCPSIVINAVLITIDLNFYPLHLCSAVWDHFCILFLPFVFPGYVIVLLYFSLLYCFIEC